MNKAGVDAFAAQVAREIELARIDQILLGRAEVRDGRRVPPWEWQRRRPVFASLADLREIGIAGDAGDWPRVRELFPWLWPDPLAFIGRAANEGQS